MQVCVLGFCVVDMWGMDSHAYLVTGRLALAGGDRRNHPFDSRHLWLLRDSLNHNCKRWITRFASRWRTQLAALNGVNCRTRRALDIRTHIAPLSHPWGFIFLRVVKRKHNSWRFVTSLLRFRLSLKLVELGICSGWSTTAVLSGTCLPLFLSAL